MNCNCGLTKHYDDAKCDIDIANGGDDYAMMMVVIMIMEVVMMMVTMT